MRLPSQDVPDSKDLIRSMSFGLEGPEDIISVDDYLAPQDMVHPLNKANQGYMDRTTVGRVVCRLVFTVSIADYLMHLV